MNFGLPYMGSKSDIIASLAMNFPKADNFYDLFGGGFSVTHFMLKNFVYCDIPYDGTASYTQEFNRKEFLDWAASREFPVYVSEYNINDNRFEQIYAIYKSVKRAANGSSAACDKKEILYWNGKN